MSGRELMHFETDALLRRRVKGVLSPTEHVIVETAGNLTEADDLLDAVRTGEVTANVLLLGTIHTPRGKSPEETFDRIIGRTERLGLGLAIVRLSSSSGVGVKLDDATYYVDLGTDLDEAVDRLPSVLDNLSTDSQ